MVKVSKYGNTLSMRGYAQNNPFHRERELLGKTIKSIREKKSMTQEDLADKAASNVSYLAKIENGYVNTSVRYLIKIARGLNVKVRDLFEF
ncbi:helix-turn-helix transcriptional regulator [Patescibacteria group bacterium]|nr:helix-turn-helix transcriptional regulator [Patescibacteria group bacterium]MBU1932212.1 helix-turn-helix transcriptional regulator [Patescibacteria group bacterium]